MFATLWIEIVFAGFVYVMAILFAVGAVYNIDYAPQLIAVKEFLPYLSAVVVGASYVTGIISHRLAQFAAPVVFPRLARIWRREMAQSPSSVPRVRILQLGSVRINRELDFQYALVALLRSLFFSLPLLCGSLVSWMLRLHKAGVLGVLFVGLLLWFASYFAYDDQWRRNERLRQKADALFQSV